VCSSDLRLPYIFGGFALVGGIAAIVVSFMVRGEQKAL
jgi:uncharacterized membrane protein HdeD (DUF308 family)